MSDAEIHGFQLSDREDAEIAQYRAVSVLALAGFLVALLSPAAFGHPLLWAVPVAGIVLCALALRRIALEAPALIGRKPAFVGLIASVIVGVAAPTAAFTYGQLIDREAREFAFQWFEILRRGEPEKSHQLTMPPEQRLPLDEGLWDFYTLGSTQRTELEAHVGRPEIRSLLALGDKARVRYYDTEARRESDDNETLEQVYAVTTEEAGRKTSFFLRLTLRRYRLSSTGRARWQLSDFRGGIRPKAEEGNAEG
ncbi:MAG: hypothetical protein ABIP48_30965 [Planctomycetota bacterium]